MFVRECSIWPLFIVLSSLLTSGILAAEPATNDPNEGGSISKYSFRPERLRSCYRWMGSGERQRWLIRKHPQFSSPSYFGRDPLKRRGDDDFNVLFCWVNPGGGLLGGKRRDGSIEEYGPALVRIDFVEDAVVFDRSLNRYFRAADSSEMTPGGNLDVSRAKGVSTEIVYANYHFRGLPWYQEIMVRSVDVILGWSFGDDLLRSVFQQDQARVLSQLIEETEMHFFRNYSTHDDPVFERTGRPYYEMELRRAAQGLEKYWRSSGENRYFKNESAPASGQARGVK